MSYHTIGIICVTAALTLDTLSYWKQIKKTLKTKRSSQVSSSQYIYKICKAICAMLGLAIYSNWVGFGIEVAMLIVYAISLGIVCYYKPKTWSLF